MRKIAVLLLTMILVSCSFREGEPAEAGAGDSTIVVVDGLGREVSVPWNPEHIICSGPGCLRLAVYLQAQDRVAAVDDMEGRRPQFDARPYFLANPGFADLPVFGEFRGHDNPELILALDPQPQVIFKTYPEMGMDPIELQEKTGIPVVVLDYGDLGDNRDKLNISLMTMGMVLDGEDRAEEVIRFLDSLEADLANRTLNVPRGSVPTCYVAGIAYQGPHGFRSTEPDYLPLRLLGTANIALESCPGPVEHADVAREQILAWDPEVIFLDVSTLQCDPQTSALWQLQNDPAYSSLTGRVYGVLPHNWYAENFGSALANAYFAGKVLFPAEFGDVDPAETADSIYSFLVGEPVFHDLDQCFSGLIFTSIVSGAADAP